MLTLPTTYSYKVYRDGGFLGELDNVTSDFSYSQVINSAGAEMAVKLQTNFEDIGSTVDSDSLVDQSGNYIVTEDGFNVLLRSTYSFTDVPINAGNDLVVTEFNATNPNGEVVFNGMIFDWSADTVDGTISLRVVGHGIELDNYIIQAGESLQLSQTTENDTRNFSNSVVNGAYRLVQAFQPTASLDYGRIEVKLALFDSTFYPSATATIELYSGTPSGTHTLLATSAPVAVTSDTAAVFSFPFTAQALTASSNYYFALISDPVGGAGPQVIAASASSSDPYAGGTVWLVDQFGATNQQATYDLWFNLYATTGNTTATFTSTDPADMLRSIIDDYQNQGGSVGYDGSSIDNTDEASSYTFIINTVLEGARKVKDLAPAYWYWFVDPATDFIHLHNTGITAEHIFVKGRHLQNMVVGQSLAAVKNIVYFSGGDIGGGVNLFRLTEDRGSIAELGSQWLERVSDNRVTLDDTADKISSSKIKVLGFDATATVLAATYDITTILPGHMVALRNYNSLMDGILMQIIGLRRSFDRVELQLGTPQPRTSKEIDNIDRRVQALETVDNPSAPT